MSGTHNKLQHWKNFNHWNFRTLSLTPIIFIFLTLTQTITWHIYLNTNSQALTISVVTAFGL